jgi:hypothetical protein
MKKILLIVSILLFTGCQDGFKFWEKKVEEKKKEEPKKVDINKSVETIKYTKKQLEVKSYFELYLSQLESLDTEGIISMTYPQLFIPINETLFKQYINTLLTSTHIAVDSFDTNITHIGTVQSYSQGEFVHLRYYSSIRLRFINPDLYNNELSIRVLNDILSSKYGEGNIVIEPEQRVITIKKEENLLAIKENENEWKFLGDNEEYRRLYPRILPLDILSQI